MSWDKMGGVTTNTRSKATEIVNWSAKQGRPVYVLWGKDSNPANTEHYSGRGVDFMTFADASLSRHDRAIGDGISQYLLENRERLGVQGIIWRQRLIGYSDRGFKSWRPMAGRGNPTANHMDHVHVLFTPADKAAGKPADQPRTGRHVVTARTGLILRTAPNGPTAKRGGKVLSHPKGAKITITAVTQAGGRWWSRGKGGRWMASEFLHPIA